MKKIYYNIAFSVVLASLSFMTTGCLEETFPESDIMTEGQIVNSDKTPLVRAIPSYMTYYTDDDYFDIGFASFNIIRDVATADCPIYNSTYDYFSSFGNLTFLGNWQMQTVMWRRHYYLTQKCNAVLSVSDLNPDGDDAVSVGNALAYRAMTYFDQARMYEYKKTDVATLDDEASSRKIYGLTVPIVTEKTTEEDTRHLPRAPFYQMYRFINNDLINAEACFEKNPYAVAKNWFSLGAVYGLEARFWLELGTRFRMHPEDLDQQLQAESQYAEWSQLGVQTAGDCYKKAAEYARKAINSGYTPLSQTEWYDKTTGFNTPNNSWMFCIIITADNGLAKYMTWQSWPSFRAPEATYGVSSSVYQAYRMIDARLYSQMDAGDWRRETWIDPDDVASQTAYNSKYAANSNLTYDQWKKFDAYCGFKFRPGGGNIDISTTGNTVSIPLMRVEEMYLIEAEAIAMSEGAGAGKQLIETFMNSYRMKSGKTYKVADASLDGVIDAIWTQKRIELWGEGQTFWDYKRRELQVVRGYPGTNHIEAYRYNSMPNAVAPWMNIYIPDRVHNLNPDAILNPDPSGAIKSIWKE